MVASHSNQDLISYANGKIFTLMYDLERTTDLVNTRSFMPYDRMTGVANQENQMNGLKNRQRVLEIIKRDDFDWQTPIPLRCLEMDKLSISDMIYTAITHPIMDDKEEDCQQPKKGVKTL